MAKKTDVKRAPEHSDLPSPVALLAEADEESPFFDLAMYAPVISKLRGKGYSYRLISAWLGERGLDLDHNQVRRIHLQSSSKQGKA